MGWADGPLLGLDLETTGRDPEQAQIVNAAIVLDLPGKPPTEWEWLAAVEIPPDTETFFDGRYTTERCRAEGLPEAEVVERMCAVLRKHWNRECPLVAYNITYDLTVFDRRNIALGCSWPCGPTEALGTTGGPLVAPCLDPYVIDRRIGRRRRGKRTLDLVARHYGVAFDTDAAHTAIADVRVTLELMRALCRKFPEMRQQSLGRMFQLQRTWHANWAVDFQEWLRAAPRRAEETDEQEAERRQVVIDGCWPIVPRGGDTTAAVAAEEERTAS